MAGESENEFHETKESINQGKHGIDYELAIASLFFKRVLDNNYEDYKLTREKIGLGKFDDLVLVYKKEGKRWYRLVQIKHIEDTNQKIMYSELTRKESYFLLTKYYNHYVESLENIKADKDFEGAELQDLVICTNIDFEEKLDKINLKQINGQDEIFQNDFNLYNLEIPKYEMREVFESNYLSPMEQLAHELLHYILLNKEINIATLVRDEANSLVKRYHLALAKHVINIKKKRFNEEFIKGNSVDNKAKQFKNILFQSSIDIAKSLIKLSADSDNFKKFKILTTNFEEIKTSLSMFVTNDQGEREKQLQNYPFKIRRDFGKEETTTHQTDFDLPNANTIDKDEIDKKIMEFLGKLFFAVQKCDDVQTTIQNELHNNDLYYDFNKRITEWCYKGSKSVIIDKKYKRIRKWFTKRNLLGETLETEVKFQGQNLKLKELFGEDKRIDDLKILLQVFCRKEFVVSGEVIDLKDLEVEYYIERTLCRHVTVKREVLKCNEDIFIIVISLNDKSTLKTWIPPKETLITINDQVHSSRFIYTYKKAFNMEDFAFLLRSIKDSSWQQTIEGAVHSQTIEGAVHWLEKIGDTLIWKQTYGSLSRIREYIDNGREHHFTENEMRTNFTDKIKIVSAVPGMGKSSLFNHAFRQIIQHDALHWVIKVDLKNMHNHFNERNWDYTNFEEIISFISKVDKLNLISEALLKHYLENKNKKITLLLDGFDEMETDAQREEIIKFSSYMNKNIEACSVWISTRPHLEEILENKLSSIAFSLEEITENEQIHLLISWWNTSNSEEIESYASRLVNKFSESIGDWERGFLGIPLQTKLLAVAFQSEVDSMKLNIPAFIDLHGLYKTFIESKYNLFFFKHCVSLAENSEGSITAKLRVPVLDSLNDAHAHLALTSGILYPTEETKDIDKNNVYLTPEEFLKIGIVYKFSDQFNFIHRTFCEYFAAMRLADFTAKESSNPKKYNNALNFLNKLVLKPQNNLVMYFFDHFVTKDLPLHGSIISGQISKIEGASENDVNKPDAIGRTPLYYAITYKKLEPLVMLLKKNVKVDVCNVFLWHSIIAYFDYISYKILFSKEKYVYIMETLLERSNTEDMPEKQRELVFNVKLLATTLTCGLWDLFHLMVDKGVRVNTFDDFVKIGISTNFETTPFKIIKDIVGITNIPGAEQFHLLNLVCLLLDKYVHDELNELAELFKEKGVNLNIENFIVQTDIHRVINNSNFSWNSLIKDFKRLLSENEEVLEKFIELGIKIEKKINVLKNGATYNSKNYKRETHLISFNFVDKIISIYLDLCENIEEIDNTNENIKNSLERLKVSFKKHLNTFKENKKLILVVHQLFTAVANNEIDLVRSCMSEAHSCGWRKKVTNARNEEGNTLLAVAKQKGHSEMYKLLGDSDL